MDDAACAGTDVEAFFPVSSSASAAADALALCGRCPVRADCLAAALAGDEHGIWGGTSYEQRARMTRRRPRKSGPPVRLGCGTAAAYARHRHRGEAPCAACVQGRNTARRAARAAGKVAP